MPSLCRVRYLTAKTLDLPVGYVEHKTGREKTVEADDAIAAINVVLADRGAPDERVTAIVSVEVLHTFPRKGFPG